jgi:hypothetical protein
MRNVIRRVARLEEAIGCAAEHAPLAIQISYVAPDGRVTDSHVITVPSPSHATRSCEGGSAGGAAGR